MILKKDDERLQVLLQNERDDMKKYFLQTDNFSYINGYITRIDKGRIKTSFCAAAWDGYNRGNDEEMTKGAYAYLDKVENDKDFFIKEQLEELEAYRNLQAIENMKSYEAIYLISFIGKNDPYTSYYKIYDDPEKISGYINQNYGKQDFENRLLQKENGKIEFRKLTEEEKQEYIDDLKITIDSFLKRVNTYWKKYQGTKLHTWAYYRD